MAAFLRDERVSNVKIDEDALRHINAAFVARFATLPPDHQHVASSAPGFLHYVIRCDNKGYRVHSFDLLVNHFREAKHVERIIFIIESAVAVESNRNAGTYCELRFDQMDPNNCYVQASSNDSDWVDIAFSSLVETLAKFRTRHAWAHSGWMQFTIQIAALFVGFLVSLWGAVQLAPNLSIENAFLISFFFFLLIFSNSWGFINHKLYQLVDFTFPNIKFERPSRDGFHRLAQALVTGLVVAVALYLINLMLSYAGRVLGEFASGSG